MVNLYPFTETVDSGASIDECVEQIDIGGPSMVRAAAKNHPSVAVVVDPIGYDGVLAAVRAGGFTLAERKMLASLAFRHTAEYDVAVASLDGRSWLRKSPPRRSRLGGRDVAACRPCCATARTRISRPRCTATTRCGRAWRRPSSCTEKRCHTTTTPTPTPPGGRRSTTKRPAWRSSSTPTRAASPISSVSVADAHRKAHECDPLRAFGGVIAANTEVTVEMAETVADIFTEVIIAPAYEPGAVEVLARKKNIRVLVAPSHCPAAPSSARSAAACWSSSATRSTRPVTTRTTGRWPPVHPPPRRRWPT